MKSSEGRIEVMLPISSYDNTNLECSADPGLGERWVVIGQKRSRPTSSISHPDDRKRASGIGLSQWV